MDFVRSASGLSWDFHGAVAILLKTLFGRIAVSREPLSAAGISARSVPKALILQFSVEVSLHMRCQSNMSNGKFEMTYQMTSSQAAPPQVPMNSAAAL